MKVLVVGAGFLGGAVANSLNASGHHVTVLSSRATALSRGIDFVHGRVEMGKDISALMAGKDAIVDAASSYVPATVEESPAVAMSVAVGNASWLARTASQNGVRSYFYLSSGGTVYGNAARGRSWSERDWPRPVSRYGALKLACEGAVDAMALGTDMRAVHVRVANAYGPGQNLARPQGIIGVALSNHLHGRQTVVYGADESVRDFLYVSDLCSLIEVLMSSRFSGPLNAGSGDGVLLSALLEEVEIVVGASLNIKHEPLRDFDARTSLLDTSMAKGMGWTPSVGLREGIEATWTWLKQTRGDSTRRLT